jgi:CRP-like cAMP-binding protein
MVQVEGLDRLLREHPFFAGMDPDSQRIVAGCAANERYEAGEYVFREGEAADKFYLIRSGAIAIEVHVPGREPVIMDTLGDGEVLGWSWIVAPYVWVFDARAVQLSRLVSLDAKCLRGKLEKDHSLGYEMFKRFVPVIADRLGAARMRLIDMYGHPAETAAERRRREVAQVSPTARPPAAGGRRRRSRGGGKGSRAGKDG